MTENQTTVTDTDVDPAAAQNGTVQNGTVENGTEQHGADHVAQSTAPVEAQELNRSAVQSVETLEESGNGASAEVAAAEADDVESGAVEGGAVESGAVEGTESDAAAGTNGATKPNGSRRAPAHDQLVAEGDAAGDYLERLLDILDFDGDIDLDVEGERAVVSIIGDGDDVDKLVGERGEVLDALQELTRLAATAETGQRSRLMLDVAGYRAKRREELSELGTRTAREVLESGEPVRLAPMNPFERKVVHDAVAAVDGVESSSDGEEPRRRVVVSPTS